MDYDSQLDWKNRRVRELLKGTVKDVRPIIGMKDPLHYRCKVHAAFDHDRKGNPISGIYEKRSHDVVPVDSCMIEDRNADAIIVSIRSLLKSFRIRTYDEDTGYGLLRHVLVRKGYATGEYLVVLVTASVIFPSRNNFVRALRKEHPEITSIVQNINERGDSMVLGERNITLFGPGFIVDELCGKRFRISPNSFYQVNPAQTEVLYRTAMKYAALSGGETVLDAYCGTGTIGIIASGQAGKVIGVELNRDAVRDAVRNAAMNHAENITFYNQDAGAFLASAGEADPAGPETGRRERGDAGTGRERRLPAGHAGQGIDVVIMDPPRAGSTSEFVHAVARSGAGKVVYVSCDPETLARDLQIFHTLGYAALKAQPVDMFPYTKGIETVCLLSQRKPDTTIEVDLDISELEVSSAETKATYEEIKSYVLKKFGLKVSNLYIAQVKRECGIVERINYNLPKTEGNRVPQCPEDKRKAIKDAFIHFQMI